MKRAWTRTPDVGEAIRKRAVLLALLFVGACRAQDAPNAATPTSATPPLPHPTPVATEPAAQTPGATPTPAPMPASSVSTTAPAGWGFDADELDAPPSGFSFGRTGNGKDGRWIVQAASDAPSKPNVLVQADADGTDYRFPIAVVDAGSFVDVKLSVSCKPISGSVDEACGLVWRFKDAKNYYLVRANALEDNVRLYHVKDGNRVQFASWSGKVAPKTWHRLVVVAKADRFVVTFDGPQILDARDSTFPHAGKVGVWTKADSITQFDDLSASAP